MILLGLLLACGSEPDKVPTPAQRADAEARALWKAAKQPASADASPPPVAPPAPKAPAADGAPAAAKIEFQGISSLYRTFFADPALQTPLTGALAGKVAGTPSLFVSYDEVAVRGHITLRLQASDLLLPVRGDGARIVVQDLAPILVALDDYRQGLGARYDLRLLNFHIGIELHGGGRTCLFGPAGDPPPDGSVVSPCVDVGGEHACGQPSEQGVSFDPGVGAAILACLRG